MKASSSTDPYAPQLRHLQQELIPNFNHLDPNVKSELSQILRIIIQPSCTRNTISQISKLNLLEQAPLLRSHIWKILIGTYEVGVNKWKHHRDKNYQLYHALKEKFCSYEITEENIVQQISKNKKHSEDYDCTSFDKQLWNQIALDTRRTHSTINFFQSEVSFTKVYASRPTKHNDILSRILYVWSKTNPAVRYVQGMNQILAPLYYLQFQWLPNYAQQHLLNTQANKQDLDNRTTSTLNKLSDMSINTETQTSAITGRWDRESEVFAMFAAIMSYIIDMHIKQMDDCQTGIMGRMIHLNRYLRVVDDQMWAKLQKQGIYPECYSFRWLALLLAQQFGLYDTIRLWDHILSYEESTRFLYVQSLCLAILKIRRPTIMSQDFTISLPMIQKLRDMQIDEVIQIGTQIYEKYQLVKINQEFLKLAELDKDKNGKQKGMKKLGKAQQIHLKGGSWSYYDLVTHTGSYIAKLTSYAIDRM